MPIYDSKCLSCEWQDERFEKVDEYPPCPQCGGRTEHVWISRTSSVIQDTFNEPIGFTAYDTHLMKTGRASEATVVRSHSERRAIMKMRGLREHIDHVGLPGSDKSKHTTSWASGPPPGVDPRPMSMMTPEEQAARHAEWMTGEDAAPKAPVALITDITDIDVPSAPLDFKTALSKSF